eukprot:scaffold5308_cov70-Phaeocystis_antarctica.AAC.1
MRRPVPPPLVREEKEQIGLARRRLRGIRSWQQSCAERRHAGVRAPRAGSASPCAAASPLRDSKFELPNSACFDALMAAGHLLAAIVPRLSLYLPCDWPHPQHCAPRTARSSAMARRPR